MPKAKASLNQNFDRLQKMRGGLQKKFMEASKVQKLEGRMSKPKSRAGHKNTQDDCYGGP